MAQQLELSDWDYFERFVSAVKLGDVKTIISGLKFDRSLANLATPAGESILFYAIKFKQLESVRILLASGAMPQKRSAVDCTTVICASSYMSFSEAEEVSAVEILKLLLENLENKKQKINIQKIYGGTALYHAVDIGAPDRVRLLLEHGASRDICDNRGISPIQLAQQGLQGEKQQFHKQFFPSTPNFRYAEVVALLNGNQPKPTPITLGI